MVNKKGEIEWMILWFLTGFISMKSIDVYDNSKAEALYLYLSAGALIIWLISSARLGFFNIFAGLRKTPKQLLLMIKYLVNDYKMWKKNGIRGAKKL